MVFLAQTSILEHKATLQTNLETGSWKQTWHDLHSLVTKNAPLAQCVHHFGARIVSSDQGVCRQRCWSLFTNISADALGFGCRERYEGGCDLWLGSGGGRKGIPNTCWCNMLRFLPAWGGFTPPRCLMPPNISMFSDARQIFPYFQKLTCVGHCPAPDFPGILYTRSSSIYPRMSPITPRGRHLCRPVWYRKAWNRLPCRPLVLLQKWRPHKHKTKRSALLLLPHPSLLPRGGGSGDADKFSVPCTSIGEQKLVPTSCKGAQFGGVP